MNDIDKINEALNLKVAAEVERRAKEWLTAAMGADWTALYEAEIRTVGRLRGELNEVVRKQNGLLNTLSDYTVMLNESRIIASDMEKERDEWKHLSSKHGAEARRLRAAMERAVVEQKNGYACSGILEDALSAAQAEPGRAASVTNKEIK